MLWQPAERVIYFNCSLKTAIFHDQDQELCSFAKGLELIFFLMTQSRNNPGMNNVHKKLVFGVFFTFAFIVKQ